MPSPDDQDFVSKTRRKQEMTALQELGEELVRLPAERLKRLPLPDNLLAALRDAQSIKSHGALRRQLQYVGRLMRDVDPAPIRQALADVRGESAAEISRFKRLERWRARLLDDESVLAEIALAYPGADLQHLRALRRSAVKEAAESRPPRSFRRLFQTLKELEEQKTVAEDAAPLSEGEDHE